MQTQTTPYKILGFNRGYYFAIRNGLLFQFTAAGLTRRVLEAFAGPRDSWPQHNFYHAVDQIFRAAERAGVFDTWKFWHDWPENVGPDGVPCVVFRSGGSIGKILNGSQT